jgi:hypothetical protein
MPFLEKVQNLFNVKPIKSKAENSDETSLNELGNPVIIAAYDFLTNPRSSKVAYYWAFLTSWMVLLRVLAIGFESCDGPNKYVGREDRSRFYFFPSADTYWILEISFYVPLVIDAFARTILLFYVIFGEENTGVLEILENDKMEIFLFFGDITGCIPFIVEVIYLRPYGLTLSHGPHLLFTIVELLITVRLLRIIRDYPSVKAIQIGLNKSAPHLVLPLFFFIVFNITAGVFFYFVEPCYDTTSCPWQDLFTATFYAVVSMTTSKLQ